MYVLCRHQSLPARGSIVAGQLILSLSFPPITPCCLWYSCSLCLVRETSSLHVCWFANTITLAAICISACRTFQPLSLSSIFGLSLHQGTVHDQSLLAMAKVSTVTYFCGNCFLPKNLVLTTNFHHSECSDWSPIALYSHWKRLDIECAYKEKLQCLAM